MADPEGTPPAPSDPRYLRPSQLKPVAPAPRVNPPNAHSTKESVPTDAPPGYEDFLAWMRNRPAEEKETAADQRASPPKKRTKFQRQDADAVTEATDEPAVTGEPPSLPADETEETAEEPARAVLRPLRGTLAGSEPTKQRTRRQQNTKPRSSWVGLLSQLLLLVLLVGSFFLGRHSVTNAVPPPTAAPAAPTVVGADGKPTVKLLSDANAALIDRAMAAEQADDFKTAGESLQKVKDSGEQVHGLDYQLAWLAAITGDKYRVIPLLNDAINNGDDPGRVYGLRARLASGARLLHDGGGMNDYETATKLEPFEAQNFFYWGEALRRAGKDQAALVHLRQALDRLREPTLRSVYQLKIRLTQIELGEDQEFADELAKQIAAPLPDMGWLFTAAAVEVHRNNYAAAAGYIDRASQRGDARAFMACLQDFFFYQHKSEKELARFYTRLVPRDPRSLDNPPPPSPSPEASATPDGGVDVLTIPPPATPGGSVPR